MKNDGMRAPLARVRGLGAAKDGVAHWWFQRVTAVVLVPLVIWFAISLIAMTGQGHAAVVEWFSNPLNAALMILLLLAAFWHGALGLQVVIEDYVHREGLKLGLMILVKALAVLCSIMGVLAVLKLVLQG